MHRDQTASPDEFNPYAPPGATDPGRVETLLPLPGFVSAGPLSPAGASLSVLHDLTDDDLKRFVELDFFYDPKPMLGFVPQWLFLVVIAGLCGGIATWGKWESAPLAVAVTIAAPFLLATSLSFVAGHNRRAARAGGFLEGRRITINSDGVGVGYPPDSDADLAVTQQRAKLRRITLAEHPVLKNTGLAEALHPWASFRGVEFRRESLIFWQDGRRRLVIPVRAFPTTEAAETFARTAVGWVDQASSRSSVGN